jgi:hypothetical protein
MVKLFEDNIVDMAIPLSCARSGVIQHIGVHKIKTGCPVAFLIVNPFEKLPCMESSGTSVLWSNRKSREVRNGLLNLKDTVLYGLYG